MLRASVVGERSCCFEAFAVRRGGVARSENAGMSSDNLGENPNRRKSKVSEATFFDFGLVGPKTSPDFIGGSSMDNGFIFPYRRESDKDIKELQSENNFILLYAGSKPQSSFNWKIR